MQKIDECGNESFLLVIPAAGKASRALALTGYGATMKPFINAGINARTVMEELVDEARASGITDICLVVKDETDASQFERFFKPFGADSELEPYLEMKHKTAELGKIRQLEEFSVSYAYQPKPLGFGHAVGLAQTRLDEAAQTKQPFAAAVVALGDDLVYGSEPGMLQAMRAWQTTGQMVVCVQSVSRDEAREYGVVLVEPTPLSECGSCCAYRVTGIEEKPTDPIPNMIHGQEKYLAILGRYVLRPVDFAFLSSESGQVGKEVDFTSLMERNLNNSELVALEIDGRWHTVGSPIETQKTALRYCLGQQGYLPELVDRQQAQRMARYALEVLVEEEHLTQQEPGVFRLTS